MKKIEGSKLKYILKMLECINASAKDLFEAAHNNGQVKEAHMFSEEESGVCTVIEGDEYFSVQISFDDDAGDEKIISFLMNAMERVTSGAQGKDVYLNINGRNSNIISKITEKNFRRDSLGYEYVLRIDEWEKFPTDERSELRGYEKEKLQEYVKLLDDSFRELNINSNEEQDQYRKSIASVESWMEGASEKGEFGALWKEGLLKGLFIIRDEYIHTIAVGVDDQRNGYGRVLLQECLGKMRESGIQEAYLHVYKENVKAQKFYRNNGFKQRGFYCENTYTR